MTVATSILAWYCLAAGAGCAVAALCGRTPSDVTVGLVALGVVGVFAVAVVAVVLALTGAGLRGDVVEWIGYAASAVLILVGAAFWAVLQRDRWATLILGVALLVVAVMAVRMNQVWFAAGWSAT